MRGSRGIPRIGLFLAKVEKTDDCWNWIGAINSGGYASFFNGKKVMSAHRWSYEHFVGKIPAGLDIDHLCRNRRCVNPEHLEPVTRQVNVRRGTNPAAGNARKTHCVRGHEFSPGNTRWEGARKHKRRCKRCESYAVKVLGAAF